MKKVFNFLIVVLFCGFVHQVFGAPELYKVTAENAIAYKDTTAKAKKLGKLPLGRKIYVFEISGKWAKIRYQKQWAYANVQDIKHTPDGWYEVTVESLPVYKEAGSKKRITSLKKGTPIYFNRFDETRQFAYIRYNLDYQKKAYYPENGKEGVVNIAGIQPTPCYYEVTAQPYAKTYASPNTNAEVLNKYKWQEYGKEVEASSYYFRNEKCVECYYGYIRLEDLKALPDSVAADKKEAYELSSERDSARRKTNKAIATIMPWIVLILTVLSLILSGIISQYKLTIRTIAIYLLAILALIFMISDPDLPNPFQTGILDKNFWRIFGIALVAASVLGCIIWLIARCFRDIKDKDNAFLAVISVAFPAIVFAIVSFFLIIWMIAMIIPLGIILLMALGGGGSSSSTEPVKETIYGPDGNRINNADGSDGILWTNSGDALYKRGDGTYSTSDGKQRYRKNDIGNNSSRLDRIN